MTYLTLRELSQIRQVCKNWKAFVDREPELWKPKDETEIDEGMNHSMQVKRSLFFPPLIDNPETQIDWERMQKQRLATKRNWMTGTAHLIKCAGHTERYVSKDYIRE